MLMALQAGVEDQQTGAVFCQESTHLLHIGVVYFGQHANELIQMSGGYVEGGRPKQAQQPALEAMGTLPVALGLLTGG